MNFREMRLLRLSCGVIVLLVAACSSEDDQTSAEVSLYDRLGGLAPIAVVVSDFIDAVALDPVLNQNAAVAAAREHAPAPYIKYQITAQVCEATGGPCRYGGRSMRDTHTGLNITDGEWDRMIVIFEETLAKHNVPAQEQQELLDIIGSTKDDIVL